jgi:hypothetical protein
LPIVSARSVRIGPKLSADRATTPSEGLNAKINPEAGEASGNWLNWTPISELMGPKLFTAAAWKCTE